MIWACGIMGEREVGGMIIGLVGPSVPCELIQKNMAVIEEDIVVKMYTREQVCESIDVIVQCETECDAIIFSGCAISAYVSERHKIKRPYASIERSAGSVAEAFWYMRKNEMALDAFSIDVIDRQVIEDLLDSFQVHAKKIYSSTFQAGVKEQEYVNWHRMLQKEKKTTIALTSFAWVYQKLKEEGYEAFYMAPGRALTRTALEAVKKEYALNLAEHAQIAVEFLQLSNYEEKQENYYSNMLKKAETEADIVTYVKGIQGSIFPFGRDEFVIFANAGSICDHKNYDNLFALQTRVKTHGFLLNIGIGMGVTAYKAEMNARKALAHSLKGNKQEIFRLDEKDILTRTMPGERQLQYSLISSDPRIQQLAEQIGLSTESILKMIAIAEVRQSYVFDAQELAECLGVTLRSGRRVLNKIVQAGCGQVYGKESAASGGRPKALIELLFK